MTRSSTRWSVNRISLATLSALSAFQASALGFDCKNVIDDKVTWNLEPLGGLHTVYHSYILEGTTTNWTFSLNLCNSLARDETIDKDKQCPDGSRGSSPGQTDCEAMLT
jgi:hypothetical protein